MMGEFARLKDTSEKLTQRLDKGGLDGLDHVLNATTRTAATYRYTYDRFLQYFRDRPTSQPLSEQDLYVGFAMAHSWMATIKQLDPSTDTIRSAVESLNRVRGMKPESLGLHRVDQGRMPPEQMAQVEAAIEPLRQFLGSAVGPSRLLHFLNPMVFPIWDSVIHRYCDRTAPHSTSDSLNRYLEYTYDVHTLINHPDFDRLVYAPLSEAMERAYKAVSDQYRTPETMGKVRAIEFIMFFGGKAESTYGLAEMVSSSSYSPQRVPPTSRPSS
jgi:hypothetical protein